MSKTFKLVMAGLVAGTLLLGAPPAHAIFGIRAARTAIAARRANKALSSSDDESKTAEDGGGRKADGVKKQTTDGMLQATGEKNPSLEELKRLEAESKKI
jgi:TRAP-type uncharacterized transport system substrate-binding protein